MTTKEEMVRTLRNLALDRNALLLMQEDITRLEEDEKQNGLPAEQREALEKERVKLLACMATTTHQVNRVERLLSFLTKEEQKVLDYTLVSPRPGAVFDLVEELNCEIANVYRIRARALSKLTRLRYGAGENIQ